MLILDTSPWHGTLSFLDIQNEALSNDFGEEYRTRVKRWVNEALSRIARRTHLAAFELAADISTEVGDAVLSWPSNDIRILGLRLTDDQVPLVAIDTAEADQWPSSSGRPTTYSLFGAGITLYPTPDAIYSLELRYLRDPLRLVDDVDTAEIPDAYSDALVAWTRYKLFRSEDDIQAAQYWRQEFESTSSELRADMQSRDVSQIRQVPSMWEGTTRRYIYPS